MRTKNLFWLAALAAVSTVAMATPRAALAADLGGDCCADLEERVAELEASTVRHANRKIQLTIGGSIIESLLFWDDGTKRDTNIVNLDTNGAKFEFGGEGKVYGDVSIGFAMSINARFGDPGDANTSALNGEYTTANVVNVDTEYVFINSGRLGRLQLGYRNTPYKSLNGGIDLGGDSTINSYNGGLVDVAAGLAIRRDDGYFAPDARGNPFAWSSAISNIGGAKDMLVRWDSASMAGFTLSAAWGGDDVWSAGLVFDRTFGSVQVNIGTAYESKTLEGTTKDDNRWLIAASMYESRSGLFFTAEYDAEVGDTTGARIYTYVDPDGIRANDVFYYTGDEAKNLFLKGGWRRDVTGLGETGLFAEYIRTTDLAPGIEGRGWGLGMTQGISSVGAVMFLQYENRSIERDDKHLIECLDGCSDLSTVIAGAKVTF